MPPFTKGEARNWAWATMRGAANVIIPSYTSDLRSLNERGIRHDVDRDVELGFWGALLVGETALSVDEYIQFVEWATDQSAGRLHLIHHATFNTLEENIDAARRASDAGAELALLTYPPSFYPSTVSDIADYTRAFCEATDLGVILFPVPLWGFERLHPASIPPTMVVELVDTIPNIVAVKAEGGMPAIGGFTDLYRRVNDRVIVTFPVEENAIPLATLVPLQFIGTSYMEYFGSSVPKMLDALFEGNIDRAMEIYWRIDPARRAARTAITAPGSNLSHRMAWKYMGWLQGFNGGPLRQPTMRVDYGQMRNLRTALSASGFDVPDDGDDAFFIGRNPG